MSTDEPFTPHADSIQTAWVLMCQQSRVSTQPPVEELEAEFDRFLARVRRDAAKAAWDEAIEEALDGWTIPASGDIEAVRFILLSANPYMPEEPAP